MKLTTEDTEDTERATPETHEFFSKCDWSSPAAIRMAELERERDEARDIIRKAIMKFSEDDSDGRIAAAMLAILSKKEPVS
jgi:hypothetical protein